MCAENLAIRPARRLPLIIKLWRVGAPSASEPPRAAMLDDPLVERDSSAKKNAWAEAYEQLTWENSKLAVIFTLFVVMRAMDRLLQKSKCDRMANYQLMYFNILWPVGVQGAQVLVCLAWVVYQRYSLGDRRYGLNFFIRHIATALGLMCPQWRLALFSLWDQLNAAITGIPGPFISQNDAGIMSNFVIIWTVIISIWYLRHALLDRALLGLCAHYNVGSGLRRCQSSDE